MAYKNEKQTPLVFIVIPIHNGLAHTRKCLAGVREIRYPHFRTIVIDDGSSDGSSEFISLHHPDVILLKGNGDLWWSGAVNRGISRALECGADYVCLLNSDNRFDPGFLDALVRTAILENVDCVCSKVYYQDSKKVFFAGGVTNALGELKMLQGADDSEFNTIKEVRWTGGMGVLYKVGVFESVGLFDEKNFPQYFGDADFSYRLRKNGAKILFQPKSIVFNDIKSTGYSYRSGKLQDLARTLFSKKSHLNAYISAKFYFKHSPWTAPIIMVKRLGRTFAGYLKALATRSSEQNS